MFNAHGIQTSIIAGVSEPEHAQLAAEFGGIPVEVPNAPLGNKWNQVTRRAHKEAPDYFFIAGSDDFFSDALIARYVPYMTYGKPYIGLYDMFFCEPRSKRALRFVGYPIDHSLFGIPLGTGRMIRADLLPVRPWQWFAPIGLDGDITRLLWETPRVMIPMTPECVAVDVKTSTNMWSFDKVDHSYRGPGYEGTLVEPADCDTTLRALPEYEELAAL